MTERPGSDRWIVATGALFGAFGIVLLALSAHGAWPTMGYAAELMLAHAPALVALPLAIAGGFLAPKLARLAVLLIGLGVLLFCADIALLNVAGHRLFPMAAPTGGFLAIGGWLLLAAAAIVPRR